MIKFVISEDFKRDICLFILRYYEGIDLVFQNVYGVLVHTVQH